MSKKSSKGEDVNDLRPFESQVSKSGQVGTGSRHASYFIVINEGAVKDKPFQQFFDELPDYVRTTFNVEFFAWNMEKNKAGKLHIHLYLELADNGVRFKTMQNRFQGAHIELRRGSPKQALLYLEKPEGVLFGGEEKSHTVVVPVQTEGDFAPYALLKWRRRSETEKMKTQEKFEYFLENCTTFQEVKYQDVHFSTMHQKSLESAFSEKQFEAFVNSDAVKTFENADGNKCYTVNRKVYYDGYIVHNGKHKPISSKTLWQRFDKLLRGAGVERCGLHSLRHTCATLLYERTGGDIKFVSNQLRHKDAGFTARTYVHQSAKRTQEILKDFQI